MAQDRLVTTQVIVVGAGPVGLMLAGELRLGGADVVVLEQRTAPTTESRASTLHARTMEILDGRGLLTPLGTPPREPRGHFAGIPLDLTLPSAYPGQWKVPQFRTERLLEDWARSLGAEVRRGCAVRGVRAAGEGADGEYVEAEVDGPDGGLRVRGRFLVGCDGEHSTVRRLVGADFPGHDARRALLRADVDGITVPNRRFERLPDGLAIAARRDDGVTRVMVHAFGGGADLDRAPDFTEVAEVWKRVTGEDISTGTPLWVNAFGDAHRQLTRYRHGRILFAGDAAHRQMPIGGQALNLGLQDAVNLGWKLALHVRGLAHPGLLDTYHAERHTVGHRVLTGIAAQARLLLGGPEVEPLRALLTELMAHEPVRAHLAGVISGLDIRYDVGGPPHPWLGARLPDLALHTAQGHVTTTESLRPGRGLLISFDAAPAPDTGGRDDRITALTALRPTPPTTPPGTGSLLVRPDGHVVWIGPARGGGVPGLRPALERWFGPSPSS
ncbi:FAD-dependent monooxygenase [Streptomyces sp. NPDC091292]|uniref:FAD-dependent monooxygenase n=1 Tax=Streptomyces sp. NPDC091292 TaxID=3365991 RepID=UPI003819ADE7